MQLLNDKKIGQVEDDAGAIAEIANLEESEFLEKAEDLKTKQYEEQISKGLKQ